MTTVLPYFDSGVFCDNKAVRYFSPSDFDIEVDTVSSSGMSSRLDLSEVGAGKIFNDNVASFSFDSPSLKIYLYNMKDYVDISDIEIFGTENINNGFTVTVETVDGQSINLDSSNFDVSHIRSEVNMEMIKSIAITVNKVPGKDVAKIKLAVYKCRGGQTESSTSMQTTMPPKDFCEEMVDATKYEDILPDERIQLMPESGSKADLRDDNRFVKLTPGNNSFEFVFEGRAVIRDINVVTPNKEFQSEISSVELDVSYKNAAMKKDRITTMSDTTKTIIYDDKFDMNAINAPLAHKIRINIQVKDNNEIQARLDIHGCCERISTGPTSTGPTSTEPTSTGPTSNVPTSTGPTSTGPTSTGPTSTGPTSTGPTSTGPTSTGPTSTPSTCHCLAQDGNTYNNESLVPDVNSCFSKICAQCQLTPIFDCSPWSDWSQCGIECNSNELKKRSRSCRFTSEATRLLAMKNDVKCNELEEERCFKEPCPSDCDTSDWSQWSACPPASCNVQAESVRNRTVATQPTNGGAECPALSETRQCAQAESCQCTGENMVKVDCANQCPYQCSHYGNSEQCFQSDCTPGCACKEPYVMEDGKCVPKSSCHCTLLIELATVQDSSVTSLKEGNGTGVAPVSLMPDDWYLTDQCKNCSCIEGAAVCVDHPCQQTSTTAAPTSSSTTTPPCEWNAWTECDYSAGQQSGIQSRQDTCGNVETKACNGPQQQCKAHLAEIYEAISPGSPELAGVVWIEKDGDLSTITDE
jgi:hypothetical protein